MGKYVFFIILFQLLLIYIGIRITISGIKEEIREKRINKDNFDKINSQIDEVFFINAQIEEYTYSLNALQEELDELNENIVKDLFIIGEREKSKQILIKLIDDSTTIRKHKLNYLLNILL